MSLWKWTAAVLLGLLSAAPSYAQWPRHYWGPEHRWDHYRWYNQYQPPPPPAPQWNTPPYQQPGQGVGTVWVYGSQNEGSWRNLGNGQWVETNPTGQWSYVETGRGPNSVDLLDQNRGIAVRITPTQEYSRSVNDPTWMPGYQGRWMQ